MARHPCLVMTFHPRSFRSLSKCNCCVVKQKNKSFCVSVFWMGAEIIVQSGCRAKIFFPCLCLLHLPFSALCDSDRVWASFCLEFPAPNETSCKTFSIFHGSLCYDADLKKTCQQNVNYETISNFTNAASFVLCIRTSE